MSSRQLLKAIGEIDDRFIDEAAEVRSAARPAARRNRRRGWAAAAACLIVAAGVSVTVLPGMLGGAGKAASENAATVDSSHFSLDDKNAGSAAPDKSLNVRESDVQNWQHEDSVSLTEPQAVSENAGQNDWTYLIVRGGNAGADGTKDGQEKPDSNVFRDAPRTLWHETVSGR